MSNHSVILQPFKGIATRYTCPSCNKRHEFTRYLSQESGEHIADHVGRCNRELHCGYHYTPKQYHEDNKGSFGTTSYNKPDDKRIVQDVEVRPIQRLPYDILEKSMVKYESNNFFMFLRTLFGVEVANSLVETYYLGTSKKWPGANIFWQVDINGDLRQAKIMLYNSSTGRRVKDTDKDYVYYAGKSILNDYEANLQQCFFGEVLLRMFPDKKVAIVESEKTAMVANIYFPDIIWLATGGSHGCKWTTHDVSKVLNNRVIMLFPDLGFYDKWKIKADLVQSIVNCRIVVSELLERNATEEQKKAGWDLADYLLLNRDTTGWALAAEGYPLIWDLKHS